MVLAYSGVLVSDSARKNLRTSCQLRGLEPAGERERESEDLTALGV